MGPSAEHQLHAYSTVRVAVSVMEPAVTVMVTACVVAGKNVVMAKVAVALPCGTVTVLGTLATRLLLVFSATTCPPNCAGPDRVTVPVALAPPVTCVGDTVTLSNCPVVTGFTVRVAVPDPTVPSVAVIVTVRTAVTANV